MPKYKSKDKVNKKIKKKRDRIGLLRHGKVDYWLLIITVALICIGLTMLLSASTPESLNKYGNSYSFFTKQLYVTIFGLVLMAIISTFDYRFLEKHPNLKWLILFVIFALLVAVELWGSTKNGAKRWLNIAGFTLQPSEFIKVGLIVFYACLLSECVRDNTIKNFWDGMAKPIGIALIIGAFLFVSENHFSAAFIIIVITGIQMLIAGMNWKWFSFFAIIGIVGLAIVGSRIDFNDDSNFRFERIYTWQHIEESKSSTAYQIRNSLYAIGSGGLKGVGLNQSKQKYLYLPEAQTDFIFSIVSEEVGFIGSVAIVGLFMLFVILGYKVTLEADDMLGKLLAGGATSLIGLQALMNLCVVTNTIPVTGVALPFFSYGGTAMMANLMAVGLILSVSKNINNKKEMREEN